ncbi:MAG: hypothetical protein IJK87_09985 [Prevotella sp.]|nr:hypothetical protein [Prevotella sp.]
MAGMESATAQTTFTKWKQVQDPSTLQTNDVVVIVDMTTANAMRNNPEYEGENTVSKASPPALKVTLKEELDRITSEVGDTIVWTADRTDGKYAFKTASKGHHLFNSDQNLRIGYVSSNDAWKRKFEMDKSLLFMEHVETGPDEFKDYHVGLKVASGIQSMMGGSTWELMADSVNTETGDTYVNKEIAATKMAFFKKVETTLPDPTLYFPGHDYEADVQNPNDFESPVATVDEAGAGSITYYSGNTELAEVNATTGVVTPKKRGTVRIYAQVAATEAYDDYLTSYILRIDDSEAAGGRNHPFSVAEAIAYAKAEGHEEETANGVGYFVKGIVSSVGGVMAGMEGMEDMMSMMSGMMEGMDMGGFDMSSMLSMFMGEQEPGTVTYAISDNGVNRDSLSVINGRGVLLDNVLVDITADSLSVGDWVTVYGPLDYSENNDMMSMFGGGNKEKTAKMPRVNYMSEHKRNLITEDITLYFGQTKQTDELFSITDLFGGELVTNTNAADNTLPKTSIKLSDTDVASWVVDGADSLLTPKKSGIITVTVNAPVLLQAGDTIKMKRKFNLDVRDRKVLPSGTMVGNYELVTDASQLKPDDKLLIVATIGDKSKVLNRKAGSNSGSDSSNPMASMFGGGGNASDITIDDDGKITEVPDDALILTLEQADDNRLLQTGRTADYIMTYLYVSDNDNGSSSMIPGMGSSGASLKTGTREAVSDSCLVSFTFLAEKNDSVKIQFNFADREKDGKTVTAKNVIRYEKGTMSTSFGGFEPESDKATLPRLYRLVQADEYSITIGETMWATIVSAYDVTLPSDEDDNIKAYIVKDVQAEETQSKAKLEAVSELKGGEPYLLHGNPGQYTLTRTTNVAKPDGNKLLISDDTTSGVKGNTTIYVLADRSKGIGFYRWTGGLLGAGRVYLSVEDRVANAHEYCGFFVDETTGIQSIDDSKTSADPFHDLQGRRVDHPTKGIYIANGKKLIVK